MFYSMLGRAVWAGGKWYLRRRYGRAYLPKPLLAGSVLAALLALVLVGQRSQSS